MMIQQMRRGSQLGLGLIVLFAASCNAAEEVAVAVEVEQTPPAGVQAVFDEFETIDPSWIMGESQDGVIRIVDGEMRIRNFSDAGTSLTAIYDERFGDQIIDVDVKLVAGTDDNWQTVEC